MLVAPLLLPASVAVEEDIGCCYVRADVDYPVADIAGGCDCVGLHADVAVDTADCCNCADFHVDAVAGTADCCCSDHAVAGLHRMLRRHV